MPTIYRTVSIKSEDLIFPAGPHAGPVTLQFQFADPTLGGSRNKSKPISNFVSGAPVNVHNMYFRISKIAGVQTIGQSLEYLFALGDFNGGGGLDSVSGQIPFSFINQNWETQVRSYLPAKGGYNSPQTRNFYFLNWNGQTIDLVIDQNNLNGSLSGQAIQLEIYFVVEVKESQLGY